MKSAAISALFAASLLFATCAFAQKFQSLSPYGERLFEERVKAYPPFNEAKAQAEAAERFKTFKKGENASFVFKGKTVSGVFQGFDGASLKIDEQRLPLGEIPADALVKFDESAAQELRNAFARNARDSYQLERMRSLERERAELLRKFPALDERRLAELFAGVEPDSRKLSLMNETARIYADSLPLQKGSAQDALEAAAGKLVSITPGLVFESSRVMDAKTLEEEKERIAGSAARRAARAATRTLRPKVATPEFEPDGGQFDPAQQIKIVCPTPGAIIHCTSDGSEPDDLSPVYSGPFKLKQAAQIRAFATHPEMNDSLTSGSARWSGLGLYASYFDHLNFTGMTSARIDTELDFDWSSSSPDPAIPADFFSVIWAGSVTAPESDEYTLHILADDGVRLWIDGRLLIDSWSDRMLRERAAKVKLEAGRPANIKIAYCECGSMPRIRLDWSSQSMRRRPVPSSCFIAKGGYADELLRWNERQGGAYVNRKSMPNPGAVEGDPLFKGMPERGK